MSRALAAVALLLATTGAVAPGAGQPPAGRWPLWEAYARHFVSEDGRVVDHGAGGRTTSEAQAYALFFALVADDRTRFARLVRWSENNLAEGDLSRRLPAWLWGRNDRGEWRVLDVNSAADADLWMAYSLLEAGRLWGVEEYGRMGLALARSIAAREVLEVEPLGALLLPAAKGFELEPDKSWRVNPSYAPIQILRRLAVFDPQGPWLRLVRGSVSMLEKTSPRGFAPDWASYHRGSGFGVDRRTGAVGSYDAIRVYLWAGMLDPAEPHRERLDRALRGMRLQWQRHERVPAKVNTRSGAVSRHDGPAGFVAALLPRATWERDGAMLDQLRLRIEAYRGVGELHGDPPSYYDENLILFGQGFAERRYRFDAGGVLRPSWERACPEH